MDEAISADAVSRKSEFHVAWIDYQKAFDMVPHDLIPNVLGNLGCSFRWLKK